MQSKACGSDTQTFRPLTKDEIDQRIETLVADLATSSGNEERQAVLEYTRGNETSGATMGDIMGSELKKLMDK